MLGHTRNHTHLGSLTQKGRSEMRAKNCGPFLSRKKIHCLRDSHTFAVAKYIHQGTCRFKHTNGTTKVKCQNKHEKKVLKINMEPD